MRAGLSSVKLARCDFERDVALLDMLAARPALHAEVDHVTVGGVSSQMFMGVPMLDQWPPDYEGAASLTDGLFGLLRGVSRLTIDVRTWVGGRCEWENNAGLRVLGARQTVRRLELSGRTGDLGPMYKGEAVIAHLVAPFGDSLRELEVSDAAELLRGPTSCPPLRPLSKLQHLFIYGHRVRAVGPVSSRLVDVLFEADMAVLRTVEIGVADGTIVLESVGQALSDGHTLILPLDYGGRDYDWIPADTRLGTLRLDVLDPATLSILCPRVADLSIARLRVRSNLHQLSSYPVVLAEMLEAEGTMRLEHLEVGEAGEFIVTSNGRAAAVQARVASACRARGIKLEDHVEIRLCVTPSSVLR